MTDIPKGPDEMPGTTKKLDIGNASIYVKIAHVEGRPTWIDITIGHGDHANYPGIESVRSVLEITCITASTLLTSGQWSIADLIDLWRGVKNCEPYGQCPQLGAIVSSPLDAAARWLQKKYG